MSRVTQEEIYEMNKLYRIYGSYAAVAKEVGRAAGTVKRYIDPNFEPVAEELMPIDWAALEAVPPIDLGAKGVLDHDIYSLLERPGMDGWYIITGAYYDTEVPPPNTSYRVIEARLIGMAYVPYLVFCRQCLGARIKQNKDGKYAGIYFQDTDRVRRFIRLLNKKFRESYEQIYTKQKLKIL